MHKIVTRILESQAPLMVVSRLTLLLSLVGMTAVRLHVIFQSWNADYLYLRDSVQYYLMGKALLSGEYLYQPMNVLALKFTGVDWYYSHPSPYPPSMALLCAPLGLIDIHTMPKIWFGLGLVALFATMVMLVHWYRRKYDWLAILILFVITIGWYPVWIDLIQGQVSIILLAMLTAAWLLIRNEHKFAGGLLLGLSVCIKLVAWPVLLYYLIKRQWHTLVGAVAMALALHAAAALVIGFEPLWDYYFRVTGDVLPYYQSYWYNLSLWSLGWRMFTGTDSQMLLGPLAPPLISLPAIAPLFSTLVVLVTLVVGLRWAYRSTDEDTAYAIMVCTSLLVSPILWAHYFSMLLVPLAIALQILKHRNYPSSGTWCLTVLGIVWAFFIEPIQSLVHNQTIFTGEETAMTAIGVSMLNLLPTISGIGLIVLLWRLSKFSLIKNNH